ncbi:hypothetical protein [Arthrobacter sp. UNC362MFTsu5.1]|uniref:hypothetical protein n=1 Tax=Arthrobacter sp. UNC362MFTsu5.1 TaxID=1449044 RepID=UPI0005BAA44C|nr:hypothetical protein [Arthrobacter sp. UNC362MFTsu5.1]
MSNLLHRHKKIVRLGRNQVLSPSPSTQSQHQSRAPLLEPIPDWAKLSRHDEITLHRDGKEVASGYVDMLALDGSVLWLIQNDGKGRAMFHQQDGLFAIREGKTPEPGVRRFYRA